MAVRSYLMVRTSWFPLPEEQFLWPLRTKLLFLRKGHFSWEIFRSFAPKRTWCASLNLTDGCCTLKFAATRPANPCVMGSLNLHRWMLLSERSTICTRRSLWADESGMLLGFLRVIQLLLISPCFKLI